MIRCEFLKLKNDETLANSIKQSTHPEKREKKEQGEGDREDPLSLSQKNKNPKWALWEHIESNHGLNLFTQA
jgi:hypothetical protein